MLNLPTWYSTGPKVGLQNQQIVITLLDVFTNKAHFLMKFGHTELIIGGSRTKNCVESAGDVRFGVAPQKPRKNAETSRR